jgi:transposase
MNCPDLNPIEKKWAQAKSTRRKFGCSIHELFIYTEL